MASLIRPGLALFSFGVTAHAILTNFTIDDSNPDPRTGNSILYAPAGIWDSGTNCVRGDCTARLDEDSVYDGTWHDGAVSFTVHSLLLRNSSSSPVGPGRQ